MPGHFAALTFRVAQFHCAIRAGHVREIIPIALTIKAPGQPSILQGFLNLRGAILPVVRLAALFDLPFSPGAYSPIIITHARDISIGLLVDAVDDVRSIDSGNLRPVTAQHTVNECAEAEFTADDHNVILLDGERLLLAEESRRIGELHGQVQRRLGRLEEARL